MKNKFIRKNNLAFTLAEVLIVIGIIGVIASIVIPSLIAKQQQAQNVAALKKQYSIFSQATSAILNDNGGSFKNIANIYGHEQIRDFYLNYVKAIKKCNGWVTYGNCWHEHTSGSTGISKYLNNTAISRNYLPLGDGSASAVLKDGTYVIFAYQDNNCSSTILPPGSEGLPNVCGWITLDVNGAKKPNIVGKDIFSIFILENRLVPMGTKNFSTTCNSSSTGLGCAAKYLLE